MLRIGLFISQLAPPLAASDQYDRIGNFDFLPACGRPPWRAFLVGTPACLLCPIFKDKISHF